MAQYHNHFKIMQIQAAVGRDNLPFLVHWIYIPSQYGNQNRTILFINKKDCGRNGDWLVICGDSPHLGLKSERKHLNKENAK